VARFETEGNDLSLRLSCVEKLEAVHGDVTVRLASVDSVELRGIRAPGTGIPNVGAVGTLRGRFGRDFVVAHGKGPAVVVELEGADYHRLIVTCPDPDGVAATIRGNIPR
jgi:hypothetical protein